MSEFLLQTHSELAYLLQNLSGLLPNLEKVLMVYRHGKGNALAVMMKTYEDSTPVDVELAEHFDYYGLERLTEGKSRYQWIDEESLPFIQRNNSTVQRDVFSEINNTVLVIRIRNKNYAHNDVFMLFFNPDASNFGPVRNDDILNTSSKSVIEQLIFNNLTHLKKQFSFQKSQFSQYKKFLSQLRDKAKLNAAKVKNTNSDLGKLRIEFSNYIIKRLSKKTGLEIAISSSALQLVEVFEYGFEKMEKWIEDAFEFARFTDYDPNQSVLVIDEWHLNEMEFEEKTSEIENIVDAKFMKVYTLLDRLESAAIKVASERKKLTGTAVGQAMDTPISAPAITDALKKNRRKILNLLEQFPQRWTLIRSEFRPIINVLDSKSGNIQLQA